MAIPPLRDVSGHSLDGRTYTIEAEQNRLLCHSLGVEPDGGGKAHPVYFYIATQVGMGVTVEGLCELCDFDVEDGPMMGSCDVTYPLPLLVDQPYQVGGTIIGLTRKKSRKLGIMDLLEFTLHLDSADGMRACTVTNTWVLPRGHDNVD